MVHSLLVVRIWSCHFGFATRLLVLDKSVLKEQYSAGYVGSTCCTRFCSQHPFALTTKAQRVIPESQHKFPYAFRGFGTEAMVPSVFAGSNSDTDLSSSPQR